MNTCESLAAYVSRASWEAVSPEARGKLKQHLLDSLGCALGAIPSGPLAAIRSEQVEVNQSGPCSLIGGGSATPERAAFYNGALVRYLDFMDTFVAPGEACHPSDNLAGVLAAAELAGASGKEFLVALALAYHIQCRLTAGGVPVMRRGFDHTWQLSISLAAAMSRLLELTEKQTAHAIALSAARLDLGATRAGEHIPQWKGLASAATAFQVLHNVRLAKHGITGPLSVFEGPLGLEGTFGKGFTIDWSHEDYDGILACSIKRYNAEFHAQSAIEAILELREENHIRPEEVRGVQVDIFKDGYDTIGGGRHSEPQAINTKEDADHSLHYLLAIALIDGEVWPEQFTPSRIRSADVQSLLQRTSSWLSLAYTRDYPQSLKCKIRVGLHDGRIFEHEKDGYEGFFRYPMAVETLLGKYKRLARISVSDSCAERIIESVTKLEERPVSALFEKLRNLELRESPVEITANVAVA
jgi:2-methylcitrate dehydratase